MAELPPPTLKLRLDEAALASNWRALDRLSGTASAGAAVKADCYGLGVDCVLPVLRDAGCEAFFIAHWSEVPAVLRHVAPASLSVLHGIQTTADCVFARESGVRPVLNSLAQASLWLETGGGPCDVMVDTGINRLGLAMTDIGSELVGQLEVGTLLSHLASADEDSALNRQQLERFRQVCAAIPALRRSLSNSAGIALGPAYHFDLTRPGLALYGGVPRGELAGEIAQVAFPQAAIIQRRRIGQGDSVGYNARFTAQHAMDIAVVSLGYADGFLRARGPGGCLHHAGRDLPILGTVSMDMIVVDLSQAPELAEGDWLDVPMDLPDAAARSGLSQYELLTVLGRRFR